MTSVSLRHDNDIDDNDVTILFYKVHRNLKAVCSIGHIAANRILLLLTDPLAVLGSWLLPD